MPSTKVATQFVVGLVAVVLAYLAKDQSWLEWLPEIARPIAGLVLAAVAAYFRAETNPAPSSFKGR